MMTALAPAFLLSSGDRILADDGSVSVVTHVAVSGNVANVSTRDEHGTALRETGFIRATRDFKVLLG